MKKSVSYYDNLSAASKGMGVPLALLKQAKEAGCPAFRGPRVHVAEYQAWTKENPGGEASKETWQIQLIKKQCRRLDLQYQQQLGELVPRGELKDAMASALQPIIGTLERHLDKSAYNAVCRDVKAALGAIAEPPGGAGELPEGEEDAA